MGEEGGDSATRLTSAEACTLPSLRNSHEDNLLKAAMLASSAVMNQHDFDTRSSITMDGIRRIHPGSRSIPSHTSAPLLSSGHRPGTSPSYDLPHHRGYSRPHDGLTHNRGRYDQVDSLRMYPSRGDIPFALTAPPSASPSIMSLLLPTSSHPSQGPTASSLPACQAPNSSVARDISVASTNMTPRPIRQPSVAPVSPAVSAESDILEQAVRVVASHYGIDPKTVHEFGQSYGSRLRRNVTMLPSIEDIAPNDAIGFPPLHDKPVQRQPPMKKVARKTPVTPSTPRNIPPPSKAPTPEIKEEFPETPDYGVDDQPLDEEDYDIDEDQVPDGEVDIDDDPNYNEHLERYNSAGTSRRQTNTDSADRKYSCDSCGKRYKQKSHLLVHRRTHDGIRPFVCDFEPCGKAFVTNSALRAHLRVHSGERPYVCCYEECGRMFSTNSNLRRHERTHAAAATAAKTDDSFD